MDFLPPGAFYCRRSSIRIYTILILLLFSRSLYSQPQFNWDKSFGRDRYEELNSLLLSHDGILAGGSTNSPTLTGIPNDSFDFYLVKTDLEGNLQWERAMGGRKSDRIWSLIETADHNIIAGGYSESGADGLKTEPSRGDTDVWIVKLTPSGQILWDKTLGGPGGDVLFDMVALPNGDLLLGCVSNSGIGGEKTDTCRGEDDVWLICVDSLGHVKWDKTIGGARKEQLSKMILLPDGTVLFCGGTNSVPNIGEIGKDFARGNVDFWLVKFDPNTREIVWDHRYGGTQEDFCYAMVVSKNGGIFLGGFSQSDPAPPSPSQNGKDAINYGGYGDFWLLKLDDEGHKMHDWTFGGTGLDQLKVMNESITGNLLLAGDSQSGVSGSKTTASHGNNDFWLIMLDPTGEKKWEKTIGGTNDDAPTEIIQFKNGAYLIGGHSLSAPGYEKKAQNYGGNDFWMISTKCNLIESLDPLGDFTPCNNEPVLLDASISGCDDCQYNWSNGATTDYLELPPGTNDTFSVLAINDLGCMATDTLYVNITLPPTLDLGPQDTVLLEDHSAVIGGNIPNLQYKWSNGNTESSLVVSTAGVYAVTVTDPNGCTASDWMRVRIAEKDGVYIPNVFSNNFDGKEDVFYVSCDKSVRRIVTMQVFDRWGTKLFQRDNFQPNYAFDGWDGTFKGTRVPPGAYKCFVQVEYLDGRKKVFSTMVTAVR